MLRGREEMPRGRENMPRGRETEIGHLGGSLYLSGLRASDLWK